MADMVSVTVVKWHTVGGIVQPVGHTYQVPADQVENLVAQGLVTVKVAGEYQTTETAPTRKAVLARGTPKRAAPATGKIKR